ncbi:hypothetical protein BLNAU_17390 [Blattamonas nauphoetae]|uniref:Uncharacterized protein n=1 Tax=Blattamonas nauphoetae TaxID=2049346 RepID=A0ABQ9X7H6_9EUKA|nr:hypothetical protein BLNAU_17390 [Blattamonas nauphoetae]
MEVISETDHPRSSVYHLGTSSLNLRDPPSSRKDPAKLLDATLKETNDAIKDLEEFVALRTDRNETNSVRLTFEKVRTVEQQLGALERKISEEERALESAELLIQTLLTEKAWFLDMVQKISESEQQNPQELLFHDTRELYSIAEKLNRPSKFKITHRTMSTSRPVYQPPNVHDVQQSQLPRFGTTYSAFRTRTVSPAPCHNAIASPEPTNRHFFASPLLSTPPHSNHPMDSTQSPSRRTPLSLREARYERKLQRSLSAPRVLQSPKRSIEEIFDF